MRKVNIRTLIDGLCSMSEDEFSSENVFQYLEANPVDVGSIEKYFVWRNDCYTRNLIYKDTRFELMAICWETGQVSRIHNHADQKCWMTVPVGRLLGQNFSVVAIDESRGYCKLAESDIFEMSEFSPAKVELEEPVHQILNLPEFGERAVSLHVYSKPYDSCLSYCRETDTFRSVPLFYTSIDAVLCQRPQS